MSGEMNKTKSVKLQFADALKIYQAIESFQQFLHTDKNFDQEFQTTETFIKQRSGDLRELVTVSLPTYLHSDISKSVECQPVVNYDACVQVSRDDFNQIF